jgi:hypothetical protein
MKKNLLILLISCFSIPLISQITITYTNMPVSGDTCRYSSASLSSVGDYTATGANYVWDFSALDSIGQGIRKFEAAFSTPYFYFGSTGYGEKIADSVGVAPFLFKNIYNFYKLSSTKFYVDGLGITFSGFAIPNFNSDKDELYMFPLNYLNRDSTTFKFSTVSTGTIPAYSKQGYRITEADGWGSITTPYGTAQCLRVVTTQYSQDSIKGVLSVAGFTVPLNLGFPNYQRSYQWLTLSEKIPYLEVSGNLNGINFTPNQVKYRDIIRYFTGIKEEASNLALSVFPNSANTELTLIIPQNTADIIAEIKDLQGKIILTKTLDQNSQIVNQHQINVSSIAKGIYLLNLSTSISKQTLKISIQ